MAQSGPELIGARLAQGATAALMEPQVLTTLHLLFADGSRGRAFGIYGIVLGLAGAAGFTLGGVLVTLDLAGLGWRAVFFVNVPFGLIIMVAAWRIMPQVPRRANLSFYLVMTLFMQKAPQIPPLKAGLVFVPPALTFVIGSRLSGIRARHRGSYVLIEGCAIQVMGLAALALTVASLHAPTGWVLALVLMIFGYGQGLVMAQLSSTVLSTVKPASAGSGSGVYGTTQQIGNAAGVAAIGAVFFAIAGADSSRHALFASLPMFALSIVACAAFLSWMRRAAA